VLRGTSKLLDRLGVRRAPAEEVSTTALGDWYANLVRVGPTQFVLCTSERSLLSVVLPARDVKRDLVRNLTAAVASLLADIGVPPDSVVAEMGEMSDYKVGPTASRGVLGHMLDFAVHLDAAFRMDPSMSLHRLSSELSQIPCGPVNYTFPAEQAKALLAEPRGRRTRG